jgi:MarR family transcriptional regulator, organic hydroperoxide resistance regulator
MKRATKVMTAGDEKMGKPGRTSMAKVKVVSSLPLTVTRPELLVDGSDAMFRKLVHSLFGFLSRHEAIRDGHAERIGLAGVEYTVLIAIAHLSKRGDVNVSTIAEHLHVTGASVTKVVNSLVAMGLAEKHGDAVDRRRVNLAVSALGRQCLTTLAPTQRQVNDVEFGGLSHDDFLRLIDILDRLIEGGNQAVALQAYLRSSAHVEPTSS